jgi:hypothetical protein
VEVLQDDHESLPLAAALDDGPEDLEDPPHPDLGAETGRRPFGVRRLQEVEEKGKGLLEAGVEEEEPTGHLLPG